MKKKKQQTSITADDEISVTIKSNNEFFNNLIQLIPTRFYNSNDDSDPKPWYQGLSKSAKASLKLQSKQNLKLARRHRFDPDPQPADVSKPSLSEEEKKPKFTETEKSVTYEELRQKLRRKIETLRGNRGESKKYDEKKLKYEAHKRKRGNESGTNHNEDDEEEVIEYGKVRIGDEDDNRLNNNKKRKTKGLTKEKELEKVRKMNELKKENPSLAEKESWKSATSRAMGVKVHDNARLIKEGIRREKKSKEKSGEKWKERVQSQEKLKFDRQSKRKENIVGRINEKKNRKIAKREKKLMRPGFEGRKDTFINKD